MVVSHQRIGSVVARPPTRAGAGPGQDVNGPLPPVWQGGPQEPASRGRDVGYFLKASFPSPTASLAFSPACLTEDLDWSARPSFFMSSSPVAEPTASLARPLSS